MSTLRLQKTLNERIMRCCSKLLLSIVYIWFLLRVVPKPNRVFYPCQQATLSLLFVKLGITFSTFITSTTSVVNRRSVKTFSVLILFAVLLFEPMQTLYYQNLYSAKGSPSMNIQNIPYNFPRNRVVRVHSDNATDWDFVTRYYWQHVDQSIVDRLVEEGVKRLTDTSNAQDAWHMIMSSYVPGDTVSIKVNGNNLLNADQNEIDALPQVINSVIRGLESIGILESDIRIIEPTDVGIGQRAFSPYYYSMIQGLYPNVTLLDTDDSRFWEYPEAVVSFPYTQDHSISNLIVETDHLILMPIMKAITPDWGISGAIKLMQGVISTPPTLHDYLALETQDNPDVLIYKNPHILNKTRLIVGDGIFGAWTSQHFPSPGNTNVPRRWLTFSNDAPNSLFFSADPVAIDSVMQAYIDAERAAQSLASTPHPQLHAGAAGGIGIHEHPPFVNIDYVELQLGIQPLHDVAIIDASISPGIAFPDRMVTATVVIRNEGLRNESFTITLYTNMSTICTSENVTLAGGESRSMTLAWDTTGLDKGVYTVSANATQVTGENHTADNYIFIGNILLTIAGDVNGDRRVDFLDISTMSAHWYPGPPQGFLGYSPDDDLSNDGEVNIIDLAVISTNWGESW